MEYIPRRKAYQTFREFTKAMDNLIVQHKLQELEYLVGSRNTHISLHPRQKEIHTVGWEPLEKKVRQDRFFLIDLSV